MPRPPSPLASPPSPARRSALPPASRRAPLALAGLGLTVAACLGTPPPAEVPPPDAAAPVEACPDVDRDPCVVGACIGLAAGGCAATVCDAMPSCCDTAWTSACATLASTTCARCEHAPAIGASGRMYVTERAGDWPVLWQIDEATGGESLFYDKVAWADWDHDGDADLALGGYCKATIFPNLGTTPATITMGAPVDVDLYDGEPCPATPFHVKSVAWGDVDRDGQLELAVAGERGLALLRHGDAGWTVEHLRPLGGEYYELMVAWVDTDDDQWLDLVVSDPFETTVYHNDHGTLIAPPAAPDGWRGPAYVERNATCDVDGDGTPELVLVDSGFLTILTPSGTGGFVQVGRVDANARGVACGDLDGDGLPELISVDENVHDPDIVPGATRVWRRGTTQEVFTEAWTSPGTYLSFGAVAIGDDDGDGDLDVLVASPDPDTNEGDWFHLFENTTTTPGTIVLVDHPGRYLADDPDRYTTGTSWLPLQPTR
ncbi:MAG: VCBS repeat-containing protein [Kofleriaceae bacterium]|nr:VCBS repeat-containing protein [Myxococcales bacterium]MCB9564432.1 VCBS repeat-containing protein [Kofleriaceae bacterium]